MDRLRPDPKSRHSAPGALRHKAEALAAPLPGLLVEAERVANTVAFGIHGRRRVGQGETFWQYRHYTQGDPRTAIDWRKSARAPKNQTLFVRDNEWEAAQSIYLHADRSASMRYSSSPDHPKKSDAAAVMTLALTLLLVRAGERVANLASHAPPSTGRATFNRIALEILNEDKTKAEQISRNVPAHARVVLVSDFLEPLDIICERMDSYTARGLTGHLVQIADPAEEDFPFDGRLTFNAPGRETQVTFGRSETLKDDYRRAFFAHRQSLVDHAARTGWTFVAHRTDRPPESTLLALYLDLAGGHIRRSLT